MNADSAMPGEPARPGLDEPPSRVLVRDHAKHDEGNHPDREDRASEDEPVEENPERSSRLGVCDGAAFDCLDALARHGSAIYHSAVVDQRSNRTELTKNVDLLGTAITMRAQCAST